MPLFSAAHLRVEADAAVATLWLDVAGRGVNALGSPVLAELDAALNHVAADETFDLLVVRSAKPSGFVVGADLREFAAVQSQADAMALSERGQRLFDKLADLRVPSVAVMHGPCLGGGLELALACDYRLVVDHPKTQLRLPEIELGLLPAWGGTQRLPRVVGLEAALKVILGGRRLTASDALRWGLADALTDSGDVPAQLAALVDQAREGGKRPRQGLPLHNWRQRFTESNPIGRLLIFRGAEKTLEQRVPDDMPAPAEALKAVGIGLSKGMEAGLAAEREAVGRLALTPACHNLVHLFFQREAARKLPAELRADLVRPVRRVGVVGAGTMGAGIAQLAAIKGFEVIVQEVNEAALTVGMAKIEALFRKAVEHRVLADGEARLKSGAVRCTTTYEGFDDVDIVVEAVIEDIDAKRAVFAELEKRVPATTLLATNTSSLLVEHLQETCNRPERIGGLHFFNPVHKMPLVEVVRGPASDDATIATLTRWAIDLGKTPVVVKDSPGFVVNRVLMPYLIEAVLLLPAIGSAEKIDGRMRRFGMPMGPLELLDQIGLDVAAHIQKTMLPLMGERYGEALPDFGKWRDKGWLGQKSGVGFYRYTGKPKRPHAEIVGDLTPESASVKDRLIDRLVLSMVNEAASCISEGLACGADAIDLALVLGAGWAPHRGGPLRYADQLGLGEAVGRLEALAKVYGPRFEPCQELRRRAATGETFHPVAEIAAPV